MIIIEVFFVLYLMKLSEGKGLQVYIFQTLQHLAMIMYYTFIIAEDSLGFDPSVKEKIVDFYAC